MVQRRNSGFTLIEILTIVVVIAVLFAVAVTTFTNAKKHTNESSAVASLRTVSTAQLQYRTRFGSFGDVGDLHGVGLLDGSFDDAEKAGYRFIASSAPSSAEWAVVAEPVDPGISGDRYFFIDESGVIRFKDGAPPTTADPPVE